MCCHACRGIGPYGESFPPGGRGVIQALVVSDRGVTPAGESLTPLHSKLTIGVVLANLNMMAIKPILGQLQVQSTVSASAKVLYEWAYTRFHNG